MGELYLKTVKQGGRTVVADCSFTSPLKIAKPFYHDGYTEIMVMCASPGMLSNDYYDMQFDMADNTKTVISGQSYLKLYKSENGEATQRIQMRVGKNAELHYLPYPVIPFAGSKFRSQTEILLTRTSKLIFCDILTCGRQGMGERFAFTSMSNQVSVSVDGRLVLLDHARLSPQEAAIDGIGFFEEHTCQALVYLYGYSEVCLPKCNGIEAFASKSREGCCVRILGNSGDNVFKFAHELANRNFFKIS